LHNVIKFLYCNSNGHQLQGKTRVTTLFIQGHQNVTSLHALSSMKCRARLNTTKI